MDPMVIISLIVIMSIGLAAFITSFRCEAHNAFGLLAISFALLSVVLVVLRAEESSQYYLQYFRTGQPDETKVMKPEWMYWMPDVVVETLFAIAAALFIAAIVLHTRRRNNLRDAKTLTIARAEAAKNFVDSAPVGTVTEHPAWDRGSLTDQPEHPSWNMNMSKSAIGRR